MKRAWIVASTTILITTAFGMPMFRGNFRDVASSAGLTSQNVYGGLTNKDFILETTGNGVAILDYDGDGRNDILLVNGTRLDASGRPPATPSTLFHNEGNRQFSNATAQSGITE